MFVSQYVNNLSDHDPIILEVSLEIECIDIPNVRRITKRNGISWAKSKPGYINNYREMLSKRLNLIIQPLTSLICQDVCCSLDSHRNTLDKYARDIIDVC